MANVRHAMIVNPIAGGGRALEAQRALEAHAKEQGIAMDWHRTSGPDDAPRLVRKALEEGAQRLWSVGGDGTFGQIGSALLSLPQGTTPPLGMIPCGTGNDLAGCLDVPLEPIAAFRAQCGDATRWLDAWYCNDRPFFNAAGAGFDAETLIQTRRFKRLGSNPAAYLLGVLATILTHRDIHVSLSAGGNVRQLPLLMAVFANGRTLGGGIRVAPNAQPDDGLLELALVHPMSKLRMPLELPKFLKGTQVGEPYAEFLPVEEADMVSETPMHVEADGEVWQDTRLCIRKAENRVLMPRRSTHSLTM